MTDKIYQVALREYRWVKFHHLILKLKNKIGWKFDWNQRVEISTRKRKKYEDAHDKNLTLYFTNFIFYHLVNSNNLFHSLK